MPDASIDSRLFRDVMGRFATGVTAVTVAIDGRRRGMTANAVASLSLRPPLVLVCIDHSSAMHAFLEAAEVFALNILAEDQRHEAEFFARLKDANDPMGGFAYHDGALGAPILDQALAWIECRVSDRYEGGDHMIVVGRVQSMAIGRAEADPLLFYAGRYRAIGGNA